MENNCHFYGYNQYGVPTEGNQCPHRAGFAPCRMEMDGKTPDWSKCIYYNIEAERDV